LENLNYKLFMKNSFESEGRSNLENLRKPIVSIEFGLPGHEWEYVLMTRPHRLAEAQEIPSEWEQKLSEFLGKEWNVMDRGHRIELMPPNRARTEEADSKLLETLWLVIGDDYEFPEIK